MVSGPSMVRIVFLTFVIGFIAAISPFLFMQLLPALLNPGMHLDPPNYLAIALTGILIGAITSILFAKQFEKKGPQDIFFYALGIPAILIATVSNLSTEFKAVHQISEVKESLSSTVLNPPQPEDIQGQPIPLTPPPPASHGGNRMGPATAWAEERKAPRESLWLRPAVFLLPSGNTQMPRQLGRIIGSIRIGGCGQNSMCPKT